MHFILFVCCCFNFGTEVEESPAQCFTGNVLTFQEDPTVQLEDQHHRIPNEETVARALEKVEFNSMRRNQ